MYNQDNFYRFSVNDDQFLYSAYTGILLKVDDRVESFLNGTEDSEVEKVLIGGETKQQLLIDQEDKPTISGLTVFITNYCNLDCAYCYNKENNVDRSEQMDISVFEKALSYIFENLNYYRIFTIQYFGGEPLLNVKFIRESIALAKEFEKKYDVKFAYSITTNGTVFTEEIKQLLVDNKFNVLVSVDGDREVHNKSRKFVNGEGSFDTILKNLQELSKYIKVQARPTITNIDTDLVALYKNLVEYGFSASNFEIVSSKEFPFDFDKDAEILQRRIRDFGDFILEEIKQNRGLKNNIFAKTLWFLHNGIKRTYCCNAGAKHYSLTPKGELYLCHRFNNVEQFKWGDVETGLDIKKRENYLREHHVTVRNESCKNCWARNLCGGGCYHAAYTVCGDTKQISDIHCFYTKELIKCSLRIYASLTSDEIQTLMKAIGG